MKKKIKDMEPGVDVFADSHKQWTPTHEVNFEKTKRLCQIVGASELPIFRRYFWIETEFEVVGRIRKDGTFEGVK